MVLTASGVNALGVLLFVVASGGFEGVSQSFLDQALLRLGRIQRGENVGVGSDVELHLDLPAVFRVPAVVSCVFFLGFYCFSPRIRL